MLWINKYDKNEYNLVIKTGNLIIMQLKINLIEQGW